VAKQKVCSRRVTIRRRNKIRERGGSTKEGKGNTREEKMCEEGRKKKRGGQMSPASAGNSGPDATG